MFRHRGGACAGLQCFEQELSLDGRSLSKAEVTAGHAGAVAIGVECGDLATHCLYMTYVHYDAASGAEPVVVSTGACVYLEHADDLSMAGNYHLTQQMLRTQGVVCSAGKTSAGMASDGSFAYVCCTGSQCNLPADYVQLQAATPLLTEHFLPSCNSSEAIACTDKYALAYGCHMTGIPLPPDDACAKYVWGQGYGCLAQSCTCDCASDSASDGSSADTAIGNATGSDTVIPLSVCQRITCATARNSSCAPGCKNSQIADGSCNGLCMTAFCDFDGGDCLASPVWQHHLSENMMALDRDGNGRVSAAEYTAPSAAPWATAAGEAVGIGPFSSINSPTWCDIGTHGLGIQDLALAAFIQDFPNQHGASGSGRIGMGSGSENKGWFKVAAHPQLDTLRTALYLLSSADVDLDGSLSFAEAHTTYELTWDEYTYLNKLAYGGSGVEAEEISSLLFSVVETLRGHAWADRDAFHGADVAASVTVKMLSRCRRMTIGEVEARALGITEQGFRFADTDASSSISYEELLQLLRGTSLSSGALEIDLTDGLFEAQLGMPGFRPKEIRWLFLPDWHYQVPYNKAPLEDATSCTHSDARQEEIRRFLFHRNRLTPRGASRSSAAHSGAGTRSATKVKQVMAAATAEGVQKLRGRVEHEVGGVSPRLDAMLRSEPGRERQSSSPPQHTPSGGSKRNILQYGSGGGTGSASQATGKAEVDPSHVKPLEYPFTVSLESPTCSFIDMVAEALEEGVYKTYHKKKDQDAADVFRHASLRTKRKQSPHKQSPDTSQPHAAVGADRALLMHGAEGNGSDVSDDVPEWTCQDQPLEFMVTDLVMAALDTDSNGVISRSEACLSESDFVVAAELCPTASDLVGKTQCLLDGGVGYGAEHGFSDSLVKYPHANISNSELDAYVTAHLFSEAAGNINGVIDIPGAVDAYTQMWARDSGVAGQSPLLDHIALAVYYLSVRAANTTGGDTSRGALDITDGVSLAEYEVLMGAMQMFYGADLTRVGDNIDRFVEYAIEHGDFDVIPEPFYSAINPSSTTPIVTLTTQQLIEVLGNLTTVLREAAGCSFGEKEQPAASAATDLSYSNLSYANSTASALPSNSSVGVGESTGMGQGGVGGLVGLHRAQHKGADDARTRDAFVDDAFQSNTSTSWSQYCGGTLIHPKWVLTAAGCVANMDLTKVVNTHAAVLGGHECINGGVQTRAQCQASTKRARLSRVVVHPLYKTDARYDVALIELQDEVLGFEPAPLDDGTDLGFLACHHPSLTAVGWWPSTLDTPTTQTAPLRRQTLEYVDFKTCRQEHLDFYGYEHLGAHDLSMCARPTTHHNFSSDTMPNSTGGGSQCWERGYFGQHGGPLLVPREGSPDGFVLAGVIRWGLGAAAGALNNGASGTTCPHDAMPRAHVRVAGMRQWILSVSALGASAPTKLSVKMQGVHLPPLSGAALSIYGGASTEGHALLDVVDYDCAANELEFDASGGMVLVLSHVDSGVPLASGTPCGQRTGLEDKWGRDCRAERVQLSVSPLGCHENAAAQALKSAQETTSVAACEDPRAGGIEGCMVCAFVWCVKAGWCVLLYGVCSCMVCAFVLALPFF